MKVQIVLGKSIRLTTDVNALKVSLVFALSDYFRPHKPRIVCNLLTLQAGLISSIASADYAASLTARPT